MTSTRLHQPTTGDYQHADDEDTCSGSAHLARTVCYFAGGGKCNKLSAARNRCACIIVKGKSAKMRACSQITNTNKHTHLRAAQTLWALDTQNKWSGSNVDCRIALLLLLLCANYLPLNQVCVVAWTEFTVFSVRPSMLAKFKILARLLAANQLWSRKSCQTYVNVYSWYVGLCINFISYLYLFTAFHRILPHFVIALKKL